MIVSASIIFSVSSFNSGLNLPFSSNTLMQSSVSRPIAFPLSPTILFGPKESRILIPSSSASFISILWAGISSFFSRHTTDTS